MEPVHAAHLLNRAAFGGTPPGIKAVTHKGLEVALLSADVHARRRRHLDRPGISRENLFRARCIELNDAVIAFVTDLKQQRNFERVLLMTFSEFARRVQENANGGTDHGAAAPMFVFGGAVKAELLGRHPNLTDLDHGDLKFNTDFRSVYGRMLGRWLKAPSQVVLGRKFPSLEIV